MHKQKFKIRTNSDLVSWLKIKEISLLTFALLSKITIIFNDIPVLGELFKNFTKDFKQSNHFCRIVKVRKYICCTHRITKNTNIINISLQSKKKIMLERRPS
jgi:hypothetical protein